MTKIQEDLELLVGNCAEAGKLCGRIFDLRKDRLSAYAALVVIGSDAQIGCVRTAALLLKFESERQSRAGEGKSVSLQSRLAVWHAGELFRALQPVNNEQCTLNSDDLTLLLREMVLLGLHTVPNGSEALGYFASQRRLTIEQLMETDAATRRLFAACKKAWLDLHAECGDLIVSCEELRQSIELTRQDFMEIFAAEFLAERAEMAHLNIAERRLDALNNNPGYSATDIEEHLKRENDKRKETLRPDQLSANYGLLVRPNEEPVENEEDYETSKHLLRRLAMLVHPDRPNRLNLAKDQRQQFKRIWDDTNVLRMRRNNVPVLCRSIGPLQRMLQLAEQIAELAGIENLDAELAVQGSNIGERIDWLDRNCGPLDQKIAVMKSELRVRDIDRELNYMRAMLNAPKRTQEKARSAMKENSSRYRNGACELEAVVNEILLA